MICRNSTSPFLKLNELGGYQGSPPSLKRVILPRAFQISSLAPMTICSQSKSIVCRLFRPPHLLPHIQLGAVTDLYRQTREAVLGSAQAPCSTRLVLPSSAFSVVYQSHIFFSFLSGAKISRIFFGRRDYSCCLLCRISPTSFRRTHSSSLLVTSSTSSASPASRLPSISFVPLLSSSSSLPH